MSFFKKLFGKQPKAEALNSSPDTQPSYTVATGTQSDLDTLKVGDTIILGNPKPNTPEYPPVWLKPSDNPFNMEIFDCRDYTLNMTSTTKDPKIAQQFLQFRNSDGKEYIGMFPENAVKCEVDLNFNTKGQQIPDGIVFKAQEMEEKWDIYKYADFLFFVRSWTGELIYFSNYIPTEEGFRVNQIVMDETSIDPEDPYFEFKVVEFLIHSHIMSFQVPHPIPKAFDKENTEAILAYSFSMFGNRGHFATLQ